MSVSNATLESIATEIGAQLGSRCRPAPERAVGGGSINSCYRWETDAGPLFVKVADRERLDMLQAEAEGLRELARAGALRVPGVLASGQAGQWAFLALEWIDSGSTTADSERKLGARLAAQHRVTAREFGWRRDNTIGLTPQINTPLADWLTFFRERRLRFQLELAASNGFGSLLSEPGERLLEKLPEMLAGHAPEPALLHGDLWGGNWLVDARGEPVIFDPAVYYGDREADLAMTRLFGGFGRAFYDAYEAEAPLPPGHEIRCELYNVYHVLNHANLFGGGYARQARGMIDRLLSATRRPRP
jgi:protein-ribulosamine 3-kinase